MTSKAKELIEIADQFHAVLALPHLSIVGLAQTLDLIDRSLRDFTVGELLTIIKEQDERTKRYFLENIDICYTTTRHIRRGTVTLNGVDYTHPTWFDLDEVTLTVTPEGPVDIHGNAPERIKPIDYLPVSRLEEAVARRNAAQSNQAPQPHREGQPPQVASRPDSGECEGDQQAEDLPHVATPEAQ